MQRKRLLRRHRRRSPQRSTIRRRRLRLKRRNCHPVAGKAHGKVRSWSCVALLTRRRDGDSCGPLEGGRLVRASPALTGQETSHGHFVAPRSTHPPLPSEADRRVHSRGPQASLIRVANHVGGACASPTPSPESSRLLADRGFQAGSCLGDSSIAALKLADPSRVLKADPLS
jgi:hypothetical protein